MDIELELQRTVDCVDLPSKKQFEKWVVVALQQINKPRKAPAMTIRVVSLAESKQLNSEYRGKNQPTNVLSFPFEPPEGVDLSEIDDNLDKYLGDLVICANLVEKEANKQLKLIESHWAHLVVHGTLHLLGYDHINDDQAKTMETLEIAILASCGFGNPYIIR